MRPPPLRNSTDGLGMHRQAFYSVFRALQTKPNPNFPFSIKKLPVRNGQELARRRMSLKVAKIINITTTARPIRNPTSWARSDSGRPLSERAQEVGFRIGLAIVVMLMIFATFNDILRLATS